MGRLTCEEEGAEARLPLATYKNTTLSRVSLSLLQSTEKRDFYLQTPIMLHHIHAMVLLESVLQSCRR